MVVFATTGQRAPLGSAQAAVDPAAAALQLAARLEAHAATNPGSISRELREESQDLRNATRHIGAGAATRGAQPMATSAFSSRHSLLNAPFSFITVTTERMGRMLGDEMASGSTCSRGELWSLFRSTTVTQGTSG